MANTPRSELLAVLPMDDVVVLPHMTVTLAVDGDSQRAAIEAARQGSRLILLVPRVEGKFGSIGTVSRLGDSAELPTGAEAFTIRGEYRARLGSGQADIGGALWVKADPINEPEPPSERAQELGREYRAMLENLVAARGANPEPPRGPRRLLAGPEHRAEDAGPRDRRPRGAADPAHRLDQAGPGRRFAEGEDPQRRRRRHGEDAARVPAAPAARGHQEAVERGLHRRRLDLPRARRQGQHARRCADRGGARARPPGADERAEPRVRLDPHVPRLDAGHPVERAVGRQLRPDRSAKDPR